VGFVFLDLLFCVKCFGGLDQWNTIRLVTTYTYKYHTLLSSPPVFSGVDVVRYLAFCELFCTSLPVQYKYLSFVARIGVRFTPVCTVNVWIYVNHVRRLNTEAQCDTIVTSIV
jgi:hypothetical protein